MWPMSKGGRAPKTTTPRKQEGGRRRSTDRTVAAVQAMEKKRQARRASVDQYRRGRIEEAKENERRGRPGDVDFQRMIKKFREAAREPRPYRVGDVQRLQVNVSVRKRPTNQKEVRRKDWDSVTILNPRVAVHFCKLRVDGITKFLDNTTFEFDQAFSEHANNDEVYS